MRHIRTRLFEFRYILFFVNKKHYFCAFSELNFLSAFKFYLITKKPCSDDLPMSFLDRRFISGPRISEKQNAYGFSYLLEIIRT